MPTENRSSNTEMVSELLPCPFCGQQDFLIERLDSDASVVICQGLTGPHEACLARGPVGVAQNEGEEQPGRDKAVELWNARAEQHQGEPAAVLYANGAVLTKADCGDVFDICCKVETPLYTHADPGEVERLRADAVTQKAIADEAWAEVEKCRENSRVITQQVDTLRSQLAEAQALLVKANYVVDHSRTIDKQAFSRGTQNVDHGLFRGLGNLLAQYDEALSVRAEPSAPVEIDERAAFEQACRKAATTRGRELAPEALRRRADGSHVNPLTECGWWGWQARAALERKPQVKP